jgi:hypothetical protein
MILSVAAQGSFNKAADWTLGSSLIYSHLRQCVSYGTEAIVPVL